MLTLGACNVPFCLTLRHRGDNGSNLKRLAQGHVAATTGLLQALLK